MNEKWYDDEQGFGCIPPEILLSTPGLELCRKMLAGELPPPTMGRTLNFKMVEAEEGRVVFRGAPLEDHYNPSGVIHGGWAGAIMDSALGCCVWTRHVANRYRIRLSGGTPCMASRYPRGAD